VTPLRCTVYVRTSSHEAVDQAYTSIDAQLDTGLAYIASQAGMGWHVTHTTYSDAEISGAVLERPGRGVAGLGQPAFEQWRLVGAAGN